MNKSELIEYLQEEYQQWEAFLDQIGQDRMEQSGVAGNWSVKDIIAHLVNWNRDLVVCLEAALLGKPAAPPPWPPHLENEDDINAWIYESNRQRPLSELLDESQQLFQELLAVINRLPDDVRIEQVQQQERVYNLVWLGDSRFPAGEFFDHFHDDHEPDIRNWLAGMEN